MVSLDQLKEFMKQKAEEDRANRSVTVSGKTLEEALSAAAVELNLPIKRIEYDVLQKGSGGFMGMGGKGWTLIAYEAAKKVVSVQTQDASFLPELDNQPLPVEPDVDGSVFVRFWHDGAYLKVTKPRGNGLAATEDQAMDALHQKGVRDINRQVVKGAVKLATETYGRVGDYIHNPANDTMITMDIEDQEMRAVVNLTPPGPGGADLSREEVEHFLKNNGVVHGLQIDAIEALIDSPVFNQKVPVALGTKPIHGQDAKITYFFDTQVKLKPREIEGRVDFKELNTIRNVLKGEELAKKEPAQKGVIGRTVTGRAIPAKDGRDFNFELGNNVALSKDGLRVVSMADGQVMLIQNRITVETVMVISGDVNNSVGNINFLGSVIIRGNVEDGFTVKAVGNIEVMGNVGKAVLETHADIIVHQGVNGGTEGRVIAGQSIWSKFIQNATAEAGSYIIVSDGILHSKVTAGRKILCKGKRAKIVGGYLKASEEINASSLGAVGTDETVLEVGFDPKVKDELDRLIEEKEKLEKDYTQLNLNYQSLMKQERIVKKLTPEKEAQKKDLAAKLMEAKSKLGKVTSNLERQQQELDSLRFVGKISASGLVYPGTKVIIKDASLDVIREYNGATFIRDGNIIRPIKYEEIEEEEIVRRG